MFNKWIRYFFAFLLIIGGLFVIPFCFENVNFRSLTADSGFDAGSSGGGSFGGGSFGGGSSDGGSFSGEGSIFPIEGNGPDAVIFAFVIEAITTSFYVIFVLNYVKSPSESFKECWKLAPGGVKVVFICRIFILIIFNFISPGLVCTYDYVIGIILACLFRGNKTMRNENVPFLTNEVSQKTLDDFHLPDSSSLKKDFYKIYVKIQEAWSINDIEMARDVLSDNLFNMYKTQILTMVNKNERNVMNDFEYVSSYINDVCVHENLLTIKVSMEVYCRDYMINTKTGYVTRGKSNVINHYFYVLTFTKNVASDNIDNCPNCCAKISSFGNTVVCEYCGSVVNKTSSNFVLADKKMAIQKIK